MTGGVGKVYLARSRAIPAREAEVRYGCCMGNGYGPLLRMATARSSSNQSYRKSTAGLVGMARRSFRRSSAIAEVPGVTRCVLGIIGKSYLTRSRAVSAHHSKAANGAAGARLRVSTWVVVSVPCRPIAIKATVKVPPAW